MSIIRVSENISKNSNRYVPGPVSCCASTKADMHSGLAMLTELSLRHGERITLNALIIKAAAEVLKRYPVLLGVWEGPDLLRLPDGEDSDISAPVAFGDRIGHFRIEHPSRRGLVEIAMDLNGQVAAGRDLPNDANPWFDEKVYRKTPHLLVANVGTTGDVAFAHAVLPQFWTSRMAICTLKKEAVVLGDDVIAARPLLPIVSGWDQRAMMGATAVGFLTDLKELLEQPSCFSEIHDKVGVGFLNG